jgi:hypothetical protein
MIPTIETIVEDLLAGAITKQQALAWLHQHAEDAFRDLRDEFAMHAMAGALGGVPGQHLAPTALAQDSYQHADAMLKERAK